MKKTDINESFKRPASSSNSLFVGFVLALNPAALIVWPSVGGAYLARYSSSSTALANIFLIAFGVMLFYFSMAYAVHSTRHRISIKYVLALSKIFGVVILGFGMYFLYSFFALLIT